MKKMNKIKLISGMLLMVVFMLCALGSGDTETSDQGSGKVDSETQKSDEIGKYTLEILSCRLAKDYQKKDVVIVKYKFTNVSDENPASFMLAFSDGVYQAGVGLNKAFVLDDSEKYSADNQTKEIKKGASIEVEVAYELNDTTTDIEVEVEELFSFNDDKIVKTFSITD